jgi:hypothetical protein
MSAFLTPLDVELVSDATNSGRGTWRLTAPLVYRSDVAGQTFTVPVGFETDYASVPRVALAFVLCGDTAHAASAVHDWLYTFHPVTRDVADAVLREAALVSGVPAWRAALLWAGVRIGGGGSHWNGAQSAM